METTHQTGGGGNLILVEGDLAKRQLIHLKLKIVEFIPQMILDGPVFKGTNR